MKRKSNSVIHLMTVINRHGQLSTKKFFFFKNYKKIL